MDNTTYIQTNTKAFLKRVTIITAFTFSLFLYITSSNVYAEPPHGGGDCENLDPGDGVEVLWCCWTETDPTDPEKIEIYECQVCNVYDDGVDCNPPVPDPDAPPTTKEDIAPENTGVIEQPPTENEPPIRSDNSVSPIDDSNSKDEQQSNPNSPLTDQRVPPGNVGVLEQLEDSSNNQNSESGDSVASDNSGFSNVVPQDSPS